MILVLNKKHDKIPDGALYVGRPSVLGNPFVIGKDGDRADVIAMFEIYFYLMLDDPEFGHVVDMLVTPPALVCWCAPEACHAEVIRDFLEKRTCAR